MSFLLALLPARYKAYAQLGLRLFQNLDTAEERDAAINFLVDAIESDGYLSVIEWSQWGKMTGIVGRQSKPKTEETTT